MTIKKTLSSFLAITFLISVTACQAIEVDQSYIIGSNTKLIIQSGDITQSHCTAIVNAANEELAGGAGVCGAIFNAAGWNNLQATCDTYAMTNGVRCPVGNARITNSFNLQTQDIKHIIHAVGPDCRIIKNPQEQDQLLKNTYTNSLLLADEHNIESVAFPFISSAIYAFPKKRACSIALKTIYDYVQNHDTKITSIYFLLFSADDFKLFCDTAHEFI